MWSVRDCMDWYLQKHAESKPVGEVTVAADREEKMTHWKNFKCL